MSDLEIIQTDNPQGTGKREQRTNEEIRMIGRNLVDKYIGALKVLAEGENKKNLPEIASEERRILEKIKQGVTEVSITNVHEQDNLPNPFSELSLEELLYLREHRELLDVIKI